MPDLEMKFLENKLTAYCGLHTYSVCNACQTRYLEQNLSPITDFPDSASETLKVVDLEAFRNICISFRPHCTKNEVFH